MGHSRNQQFSNVAVEKRCKDNIATIFGMKKGSTMINSNENRTKRELNYNRSDCFPTLDKERNYANRQPKSYNCFHLCTYRSTLQLIPRKNLFLAQK